MGPLKSAFNILQGVLNDLVSLIFPNSPTERRLENLTGAKIKLFFPNEWISADQKVFSLLPYKDNFVKESIHLFKYKRNESALKIFAEILGESMISFAEEKLYFLNSPKIILIPIPEHHKSNRDRGFNHLELLCKKIIGIYGEEFFELRNDILFFQKEIRRQTECKSKKERQENMKNAFKVLTNSSDLNGRLIFLIDDVTTTGATFREACRALEDSGAISPKFLYCFALGH